MSVILSYAEVVTSELPEGSPALGDLRQIIDAGQRAERLTRQLLTFSRREPLAVVPVDVGLLLDGLAAMLRRTLGDVQLRVEKGPGAHRTLGDRGHLEQVVLNIVVNARDAMPNGGTVTLAVVEATLGATEAMPLELPPGDYVELCVTDTGVGMDAGTRERIFEPFFTTKAVGKGTGLGLATAFSIVKQCRGAISVTSTVGVGTTFRILLPRAPSLASDAGDGPRDHATTAISAAKRTIVIVEDDAQVRSAVGRVLRSAGYTVVACEGAADAMTYLQQPGAVMDLLLTDVVMPDVRGTELARRVLAMLPDTKVLFMSGYAQMDDEEALDHPLVRKPFRNQDLLAQIHAVLGDDRGEPT